MTLLANDLSQSFTKLSINLNVCLSISVFSFLYIYPSLSQFILDYLSYFVQISPEMIITHVVGVPTCHLANVFPGWGWWMSSTDTCHNLYCYHLFPNQNLILLISHMPKMDPHTEHLTSLTYKMPAQNTVRCASHQVVWLDTLQFIRMCQGLQLTRDWLNTTFVYEELSC